MPFSRVGAINWFHWRHAMRCPRCTGCGNSRPTVVMSHQPALLSHDFPRFYAPNPRPNPRSGRAKSGWRHNERECDALARSACELVHTAGGGVSAIGTDMREHVLLFCLLGLVLIAAIMLLIAPEEVTWALSLIDEMT